MMIKLSTIKSNPNNPRVIKDEKFQKLVNSIKEFPKMKPVGLFGYQIENSSKVNDIIIDAFGGSGTTMVACEQLKRKARVIEFDPKYCDVIVNRMIKLDNTLTIKRNGVDVTNDWK
jgi:DNA modification methylase